MVGPVVEVREEGEDLRAGFGGQDPGGCPRVATAGDGAPGLPPGGPEVDGGGPDTRRVGFTGTYYVADAARGVRVEGYLLVTRRGGWKVDDMVSPGVEGIALAGPQSLVEEFPRSSSPPLPGAAGDPARDPKPAGETASTPDRPSWFRRNAKGIGVVGSLLALAAYRRFEEWRRKRSAPDDGSAARRLVPDEPPPPGPRPLASGKPGPPRATRSRVGLGSGHARRPPAKAGRGYFRRD